MSLQTAIFLLPGLGVGLSLHEFAHAWSASLLGDDFSRRQGRVSLNPARHLSILGTLALFVIGFGWGKPVQVNLHNFKHPKRDYLITSLAGPLANVFLILCCAALSLLTRHDYALGASARPYVTFVHYLLMSTAAINAILATINLLPIPPLDGSKIWPCLIPGLKPAFGAKYIWLFIFGVMFLVQSGHLDPVFRFAVNSSAYYMPDSDSVVYADNIAGGKYAREKGAPALAEAFFSEAIAINPQGHEAFYQRGITRSSTGNLAGALEDIDKAINLNARAPEYSNIRKGIVEEMASRAGEPESQPASRPASRPASGPAETDIEPQTE